MKEKLISFVCVHVYAHAYGSQKIACVVLLWNFCPLCFLRRGLSRIWNSPWRTVWLTRDPWASSHLHLPSAVIINVLYHPWLSHMSSGNRTWVLILARQASSQCKRSLLYELKILSRTLKQSKTRDHALGSQGKISIKYLLSHEFLTLNFQNRAK